MKIYITMEIDNVYADPGHEMGVTDDGYMRIVNALMGLGDDIDVHREVPDV